MPQIQVNWSEALETLVDAQSVRDALSDTLREHILSDAQFRAAVVQVVNSMGPQITADAIAKGFQKEVFFLLEQKNAALKKELLQCVQDFLTMQTMHASDYARRRHEELLKSLNQIDAQ